MFENVPTLLQLHAQWLVWKAVKIVTKDGKEKLTKVPYSAIHQGLASVTNPATWATFKDCVELVARDGQYAGIGYVFVKHRKITGVDLDEPIDDAQQAQHVAIMEQFRGTYIEWSPSGRGVHIIGQGDIPSGRRDQGKHIEIYNDKRFFTFTGNPIGGYSGPDVLDCQQQLTGLHGWLRPSAEKELTEFQSEAAIMTDEQLHNVCSNMRTNGQLYQALMAGDWQSHVRQDGSRRFPSASEADMALLDLLSYNTNNKDQVFRLFKASPLGSRDKYQGRDALIQTQVNRAFDMKVPTPQSVLNIMEVMNASVPIEQLEQTLENTKSDPYTLPPGFVGELANCMYSMSLYPCKEIALAGALSLMAGVCGRNYNVWGSGLNLYLILLAPTGTGKSLPKQAMNTLLNAVFQRAKDKATTDGLRAKEFLGPESFASGAALLRTLAGKGKTPPRPCFVSIWDEFADNLAKYSSDKATQNDALLKSAILKVYTESGPNGTYAGTAHSDSDNDVGSVRSPALTLLTQGVPEAFYRAVSEKMVTDGLLPRFTIIDTTEWPKRMQSNIGREPPTELVDKLAYLTSKCAAANTPVKPVITAVDFASLDAMELSDRYIDFCDRKKEAGTTVEQGMWARAAHKMIKLAALIAVGLDPDFPRITEECLTWAINLTNHEIDKIMGKFANGDIGENLERDQTRAVLQIIADYFQKPLTGGYVEYETLRAHGLIPHGYLNKRLSRQACFYRDRMGSAIAIKRACTGLVEDGITARLAANELVAYNMQTAVVYRVLDPKRVLRELEKIVK